MIDAIYTSKLYRTSKRKSAIVAAANNPINTELVTQLADALSPVYKKEEYLIDKDEQRAKAEAQASREAEEASEANTDNPDDTNTSPHSASKPRSHIADSFRKAAKHEAEANENEAPSANVSEESSTASENSKTSADSAVENSTSANNEPITASARMLVTDMKQQVDQIKGLLNLSESTAGVNRILVKDSEMWIYYNDSINLNNVMASAIESLNAAGYTYLEFNRLARSDNAMVFQLMFKDTDEEIKPVESEEKDEKND